VIAILIWAGFASLCLATTVTSETKAKLPTAFELLDRYAANQDKLKSFVAKGKAVSTNLRLPLDGPAQQTRSERHTEFRYEDSGSDLVFYYWWRDLDRGDDGILVPEDRWKTLLWDGKRLYDYYRGPSLRSSKVTVISDEDYMKHGIAIVYPGAITILGILECDIDRFDSILRQSNSISVRSELERVGLVDCYVIDAKSEHGTYTVWLDPEHGYGIAKAVVHKGPEDFRMGQPRSSFPRPTSHARSFFLENVQFENLQGVWVPMEADFHSVSKRQEGTNDYHTHFKITEIAIDPNHAELQSFVLDVENGTRIKIVDEPRFEYRWHDGKKFVVDEWDGSIRYVPKEWSILVDVGKQLPKFEGIKLRLSAEESKNKAILLCFFDMNQRPSRNCIMRLTKQAQQLKQKGVTVVAVQASKVDENTLNQWVKKYKILFPVGMVQDDEEETRFIWGVKFLPWLILTDRKHTVRAEGFTLAELDEKIKESNDVEE